MREIFGIYKSRAQDVTHNANDPIEEFEWNSILEYNAKMVICEMRENVKPDWVIGSWERRNIWNKRNKISESRPEPTQEETDRTINFYKTSS